MTVDDLIEALQWAKTQPGITGDTTVTFGPDEYDVETVTITAWTEDISLVNISAQ